jgi:hypothetical protein
MFLKPRYQLCNKGSLEDNAILTQWLVLIKWKAIFSYDHCYGDKDSLYNQILASNDHLR